MSQRINLLAAVVVALMLGSTQVSDAQTSQNSSSDEAAIRQVVKQVEDGWNAHDGKAFAASFASDADYVVVNGMRATGREEIEKGHTAIFTTIYKESHNAGTVAELDGRWDDKAELLAYLLATEGRGSSASVMVGDRAADIMAGKANEVRSIGVLWGYGLETELTDGGADMLSRTPSELATHLSEAQSN